MTLSLIVEADGGARGNPGPAAFGTVVRDAMTGAILAEVAGYLGVATNNVAEYRGAIRGLEQAFALDPGATIEVRLDSKLIVEQMSGRWKIKHPDMRVLALAARDIFPPGQVTYVWVPRAQNVVADALVNEVLDLALAGGPTEIVRLAGEIPPDLDLSDVAGGAQEAHARAVVEKPRPGNRLMGWTDLGPPTITVLARHGATAFSLEKRFSGPGGQDLPLAPIGVQQGQALAAELAERGGIDLIIASPLLRAQQTAHLVAKATGLEIKTDADFAECAFGEWDGLTFAEVQAGWPDLVEDWLRSTAVAPPGGESLDEVKFRVDRGRRRLIDDFAGQRLAVIAHVTPIKIMVGIAVDAALDSVFRMELAPCSITTLAWFPDGNASMFSFSESAHLRKVRSPDGT
ncbi:MAG: bifunctional RNase H/acid phosphatase [Actinomycetota bacterium]|nr:bifunctional RNase H/acid phosphatase [Actinomycetota bacterium]